MQHVQDLADGRKNDSHEGPEERPIVEIHVNGKKVRVIGHRQSGLEIKVAAIAQHVQIEIDFLLYLIREHQPNKPIADDEEVGVTEESRFHAIADDDNS